MPIDDDLEKRERRQKAVMDKFYALKARSMEFTKAFFERKTPVEDGRAALRARFPNAPEEMIYTAAHHVYEDGCVAALDFIAAAERLLRDPHTEDGPHIGVTFELLYHVYNWHQFQELLPDAKPYLLELLKEMKQAVAEDDREGIIKTVNQLECVMEGGQSPPDFEPADCP